MLFGGFGKEGKVEWRVIKFGGKCGVACVLLYIGFTARSVCKCDKT